MSKKKNTTENPEVLEGELLEEGLLPFNPLMGSPIIDVIDETNQKITMVNEIESLAELNKQHLMVKKEQTELMVDNQKYDTALKTISTIDKIINAVASEKVLERVAKNINTPQDMKYMAEAAEKLTGTLRNLMNPNVADEFGNKKRHKINFMFKSNGPVQAAVQVETSND